MDKLELKILIGLHRAVNYIDAHSTRIFSKYGLTMGQFAVLEVLYHKGDLSVGEVQEKILSSSGTIPLIVNNLEKRGFVVRCKDAKDKRRCVLHISESGRELIEQVYPKNEAMIISLMDNLSISEKQQFVSLLKQIGDETYGKNN